MNKIKQFLRDIFAPQAHYYYYKRSDKSNIKPEDWEVIDKDVKQVEKDIKTVFKDIEKLFNK